MFKLFRIKKYQYGTQVFLFNSKFKMTFKKSWYFGKYCFMFYKGNSSFWIDTPFIEFKIKRNYKGHFIC